MARAVFLHVLTHALIKFLSILGLSHIDEIYNDDSTHISQS